MKTTSKRLASGLLLLTALGTTALTGCQTDVGGQILPSGYYLRDDVQFHPAVFKPQVVAPGSSVTIQIIFLPRDRGLVDSKLLIETEAGAFTFPVRGLGTENPYKLTGFVGARVPIGVLYNPPIRIYNPFPTVRSEATRRGRGS